MRCEAARKDGAFMEEKLVLVSGYGVPGEDDIALYGIAGERAVRR